MPALIELRSREALSLSTCTSTPGAGDAYIRFLRFDSLAHICGGGQDQGSICPTTKLHALGAMYRL